MTFEKATETKAVEVHSRALGKVINEVVQNNLVTCNYSPLHCSLDISHNSVSAVLTSVMTSPTVYLG